MPISAATKAKTKSTANNVVPIDPSKFASLNQLELAALYNTSPRTIGRRLKEGWKPGTPLPVNRRTSRHSFSSQSAKIIESNQQVPTNVADPARFAPTNADPSAERADFAEIRADRFDIWSAMVLVVAIGLASVAAYFSVTGMTRIFPGATIAIIAMASMMEGGKLIGAAWLSRRWRVTNWLLRMILVVLLAILALINATGVFGQLSAAHIDPHVEVIATTDELAAANQASIEVKQNMIADLTRRIAQIDAAIEENTKRGRTTAAMALSQGQRPNRQQLVAGRLRAEGELNVLKIQQVRIIGAQSRASADIGVLEYAAALVGIDRERVTQWLILAMVLTCDPLSLALVVATGAHNRRRTTATGLPAISCLYRYPVGVSTLRKSRRKAAGAFSLISAPHLAGTAANACTVDPLNTAADFSGQGRWSLGSLQDLVLLDWPFERYEFLEARRPRVAHAQPSRMSDGRSDERQHLRVRTPHVIGSDRVVSAREQYACAVKERLPARYEEFVADVSEKAPGLRRGADYQND